MTHANASVTSSSPSLFGERRQRMMLWYRRHRNTIIPYCVLTPIFTWYFIFIAIPLLFGAGLSFTEWNALTPRPIWVGLRNFITFFTSKAYLRSLGIQFWLGGLCLAVGLVASFILALFLDVPMKLRGFFRVAWYVPAVTAVPTTAAVFSSLLDPTYGGINGFIRGMGGKPVLWTLSSFWMTFWIVVYGLWRGIGPRAILWLAGLQSIDPQVVEAAKVDGANTAQLIWYIYVPGLKPIAAFLIITGFIGAMQMFEDVMFISGGGPVGATDVLMFRVFRDGLRSFNLGMAGASSMVLGIIISIFSILYFRIFVSEKSE